MLNRRQFLRFSNYVLLVGLLSAILAGCAGNNKLSLEEYADWCGERSEDDTGLDSLDSLTWGEAAALLDELVEDAIDVVPPEELEEYHDASVTALEAFVAVANDKEPDDPFNPFELLGVGLVIVGTVEEAERNLSARTRDALEAAGCISSDDNEDDAGVIDREDPAGIGERISVYRPQANDRFDLIIHGQPTREGDLFRLEVTVFATAEEWTYDTSLWTDDGIELISEPDSQGRIYRIREADLLWDEPTDWLKGVFLVAGGQHRGALYFSGEAPAGTRIVELRYPSGELTRIVELNR